MNEVKINRVLISVSDKSGIVEFARTLTQWNIEIISTGGTLNILKEAEIPVKSVSEVTGFPEILDGRVKTLHPKIHAGLLAAADNLTHRQQLQELDIASIDLVVVNLYPFEQTVSKNGISLSEAIEQIDIGGPTLLRAAAKNFKFKTVATRPEQYATIISELEKHDGCVSEELRAELAKEVFLRTSQYDSAIARYLTSHASQPKASTRYESASGGDMPVPPKAGRGEPQAQSRSKEALPAVYAVSLPKLIELRYGENPHQQGALYGCFDTFFEKLHGKELSFNNIVDIQAAVDLVEEFPEPTVVIMKHTNPCGVGSAATIEEAYRKALATDTKSAFGGIIAVNRPLEIAAAKEMNEIFTEVIIAPEFPSEVMDFLKKKKDRRLILQKRPVRGSKNREMKTVAGGFLVQTSDTATVQEDQLRVVTKRKPTEDEIAAMLYAWRVAKHVKSNAIVYARSDRTVGIGAGQTSRLDSAKIAVLKAREVGLDLKGTAVASDAFFPFADGFLEAVKAGATAVIQPGGSIRDEEVVRGADENAIAMIFTGIRHFKH